MVGWAVPAAVAAVVKNIGEKVQGKSEKTVAEKIKQAAEKVNGRNARETVSIGGNQGENEAGRKSESLGQGQKTARSTAVGIGNSGGV